MPRLKTAKKKKDIVSEEFKAVIESLQTSELKERIVTLSRQEGEVLKARREDDALTECSATLKELKAPYSEALKVVRAERAYAHSTLEERGS
jgi:hypothetical protein